MEGPQSLPFSWKALRAFPFLGRTSEPSPFLEGLQSLSCLERPSEPSFCGRTSGPSPFLEGPQSLPLLGRPSERPHVWNALRAFPCLEGPQSLPMFGRPSEPPHVWKALRASPCSNQAFKFLLLPIAYNVNVLVYRNVMWEV